MSRQVNKQRKEEKRKREQKKRRKGNRKPTTETCNGEREANKNRQIYTIYELPMFVTVCEDHHDTNTATNYN